MRKSWVKKVIAISIIALFVEAGVASANYRNQSINSKTLSLGNTLYVGGIGPNNYTTIQKAIDNASDGDTVFVYDESSPYYENVIINKSLTLLGENEYTTIIDGKNNHNVIHLFTSNIVVNGIVTIRNFTIQNASIAGIATSSSNWHLKDIEIGNNFIKNTEAGIRLGVIFNDLNLTIWSNYFENNEIGIYIDGKFDGGPQSSWIGSNIFMNNTNGIQLSNIKASAKLTININSFSNNEQCIYLITTSDIEISSNHFEKNTGGIYLEDTSISNNIYHNNFINNTQAVFFKNCFVNKWKENYWDTWIGLLPPNWNWLKTFPKAILGHYGPLPWYNFDWGPAEQPYPVP